MPLNQVSLDLPHRVEHDTNDDQQTCATEKLSGDYRYVQPLAEEAWKNCDERQKNRAGKRQPRHREIKKISCWFSRAHTGDVTAVFFQIIRNLSWLKLCRDPEIAEEENHRCENDIMNPAGGKRSSNARGCGAVSKSVLDNRGWE